MHQQPQEIREGFNEQIRRIDERLNELLGLLWSTIQCTPPPERTSRPPSLVNPTPVTGTIPKAPSFTTPGSNQGQMNMSQDRNSEQEFTYRCRRLGARRREFDTNYHNILIEMLESNTFNGPLVRHALEELEILYQRLKEKRIHCESVLSEEELANSPNYLLPIKRLLSQYEVNNRFPFVMDPFPDLWSIAQDDASWSASNSSNLQWLEKQLTSVVAMSYDVTRHVTKFDGQLVFTCAYWRW